VKSLRDVDPVRELTKEEKQDIIDNYDLFAIRPERIVFDPSGKFKYIYFNHPATGELVRTKAKVE
jgi:hypothetical protein